MVCIAALNHRPSFLIVAIMKNLKNAPRSVYARIKGKLLGRLVLPLYSYWFLYFCSLLFSHRHKERGIVNKIANVSDLVDSDFLNTYKDILSWQGQEVLLTNINHNSCPVEDYEKITSLYRKRVSHRGKPGRSRRLYYEMIWETCWAIMNMNLKPGLKVADIGSENSCLPSYCAYSGCTAYGLDVFVGGYGEYFRNNILSRCHNSELILDIQDRYGGIQNVIYQIQDATKLTVQDSFFDKILCISTIEHIWDDTKAIQEMARTLKPHGILAITCPFSICYSQNPYKPGLDSLYADAGRIYTKETLFSRLINPSGLSLVGGYGFSLSPKEWRSHHFPSQAEDFV